MFGGALVAAVPDELCAEVFGMSDAACFDPSYPAEGDWAWEFIKESSRKVRDAMARKVRGHLSANLN